MKALKNAFFAGVLCATLGACGDDEVNFERDELKEPTLLELDLREPFSERGEAFFGASRPSLTSAVSRVRSLADDALAKGLFVRVSSMRGHLADVEDWVRAFEALRAQKKAVHCHFDDADNAAYALAAHCDRVSMAPSGTLDLVGLAVQAVHGRALLESIGVQADLLQIGKYKGASEPFTRDEMSEPLRESLTGLLDDLDGRFREHLHQGRKFPKDQLSTLIDGGPYHAKDALKLGLVDALAYDDESRAKAKEAVKAKRVRELFPERDREEFSFKDLLEAFSGEKDKPRRGTPRLVLATLTGDIVMGDQMGPDRAASEPFVKAMRRFADDVDVKAVVLRIESPGGSALASDRMWHAVRRVAGRKPVIVSLGDVAASGGYYVASAATTILATESSLVGSIGVVGGKMVVKNLADRVGVHTQTITRGAHAAWLSPLSPFSDEERKVLDGLLRDTYDRFLERVSIGRKRPIDALTPAAEGRVMGGARAVSLGLVDELGGVAQAITIAKDKGHLPRDARIETWPSADDPFRALSGMIGGASAPEVQAARELALEVTNVLESPLTSAFKDGPPVAAVLPFDLRVR